MTNGKSTNSPTTVLTFIVIGVLLLAGVLLFAVNRGPEGGNPPLAGNGKGDRGEQPRGGSEHEPAWEKTRAAAHKLQLAKDWCGAEKKWGQLLDELSTGDSSADTNGDSVREEAGRNQRLCGELCQPSGRRVDQHKPAKPERPPEKISEENLVAAYPKGREVHSIAYLLIDGHGTNDAWVFRQSVSFHYQYRVRVETRVKENRRTAVVFDQHFTGVDELRAISKRELEFHWPESPIVRELARQADRQLSQVPQYIVLKVAAGAWNIIDPGGKRTLTRLQRFIPELNDSQDLEIVERVKDLSGQRLELEYVSGLGVTEIKVLDGQSLDPDLLDRVARGSTVLMDYFVDRAVKEESPEFDLDTKDVGDMFNVGDEGSVAGAVHFQRAETDNAGLLELNVTGGELAIEIDEAGASQRTHVTPKSGVMHYSPRQQLVTDARCTWHADSLWATNDHLLFGTTAVRDLAVRTYYEAELISAGAKNASDARANVEEEASLGKARDD